MSMEAAMEDKLLKANLEIESLKKELGLDSTYDA